MNSSDTRTFGGIARLYGDEALEKLRRAHVCVIGTGGVGSWCAEALIRTAVGNLTLIDGDCVAQSNINRQLPATLQTLSEFKAVVLKNRFETINPSATITAITEYVSDTNFERLIPADAIIVDAIDSLQAKTNLIAWAKSKHRTIFVSGGAGGRTDPSRIQSADLALTQGDALLAKVRTALRKSHGFPQGNQDPKKMRKFGIPAVFSNEITAPSRSEIAPDAGFGTNMTVTASVGLRLANLIIDCILMKHL